MAGAFTLIFFWLINRQYQTFQLRGADIDRFTQAIWNTPRGRFLYSTILEESILAKHFSPYMALLTPLLLIWADARILFLFQLIGIAITGLILYRVIEDKRPGLALIFLLAFYLNPPLHQIALIELRRVTLAMPFIALMLYGLYKDKRGLMLIGMVMALLIKEDMGLVVAMVGMFLLFFKRDWCWGLPIALAGLVWFFGMLLVVIPALADGSYFQLGYYAEWGNSIGEIAKSILTHPGQTLQHMFDRSSIKALWRLLLPLAVILPFIGAEYLLIILPLVALMLLSNEPAMHKLQRWYLAPVLPVLFAAVAVGIGRLTEIFSRWAAVALLVATLIAYGLYSQAPLGGRFEPERYRRSENQDLLWELIKQIPEDATVVAQVAFSTPLALREQIYVYPWFDPVEDSADYFVMGRSNFSYPFDEFEINWEINNLIAEPQLTIIEEVDGFYIFQPRGQPLPSRMINAVAEEAIKLEKVEVAVTNQDGRYQTVSHEPLTFKQGQQLRITLYWRALASSNDNRTVSVRIIDSGGALAAQHDMQPSEGSRPTSWWEPGWNFRDVYYLTLSPEFTPGPASLDLLLYDSVTQDRVNFGDEEIIRLWNLILQ
jgi:uncharacterized membrane protein